MLLGLKNSCPPTTPQSNVANQPRNPPPISSGSRTRRSFYSKAARYNCGGNASEPGNSPIRMYTLAPAIISPPPPPAPKAFNPVSAARKTLPRAFPAGVAGQKRACRSRVRKGNKRPPEERRLPREKTTIRRCGETPAFCRMCSRFCSTRVRCLACRACTQKCREVLILVCRVGGMVLGALP